MFWIYSGTPVDNHPLSRPLWRGFPYATALPFVSLTPPPRCQAKFLTYLFVSYFAFHSEGIKAVDYFFDADCEIKPFWLVVGLPQQATVRE